MVCSHAKLYFCNNHSYKYLVVRTKAWIKIQIMWSIIASGIFREGGAMGAVAPGSTFLGGS